MNRQCPACGAEVHAVASRCKHCKADLPDSPPVPESAPPVRDPRGEPRASWIHRWPLIVAGVALLAIGISVGIMLERWMASRDDTTTRRPGTSPHRIPDQMPRPSLPPPGAAPPVSPAAPMTR